MQGAKLQYGHVPVYESGENPNAKQFQSLHAVQVRGRQMPAARLPCAVHHAACLLALLRTCPALPCSVLGPASAGKSALLTPIADSQHVRSPPCRPAHPASLASPPCLQRHMVDTNQCKMAFDGCEEEYEDFYDYGEGDEAMDQGEWGGEGVRGCVPLWQPGSGSG